MTEEEEVDGCWNATLILNIDSLSPLLEAHQMVICGFGTIYLLVFEADYKEKPLGPENLKQMSCRVINWGAVACRATRGDSSQRYPVEAEVNWQEPRQYFSPNKNL